MANKRKQRRRTRRSPNQLNGAPSSISGEIPLLAIKSTTKEVVSLTPQIAPMLSAIAGTFAQYRWAGLTIKYVPYSAAQVGLLAVKTAKSLKEVSEKSLSGAMAGAHKLCPAGSAFTLPLPSTSGWLICPGTTGADAPESCSNHVLVVVESGSGNLGQLVLQYVIQFQGPTGAPGVAAPRQ